MSKPTASYRLYEAVRTAEDGLDDESADRQYLLEELVGSVSGVLPSVDSLISQVVQLEAEVELTRMKKDAARTAVQQMLDYFNGPSMRLHVERWSRMAELPTDQK